MLRYKIAKKDERNHLLGSGSYGKVYLGTEKATNTQVAIKKVVYNMDDLIEPVSALREAHILRYMNHPNIISLIDLEVDIAKHTMFLILPRMDTDLWAIIRTPMENGHPQPLSHAHLHFFMYQLISAVSHLHAHNIIHRDLKPSNILIDSSCNIKVTDFGSARWLSSDRALTWNVTTLEYCAPESLLGEVYGVKVDVWGLGVILGELLLRRGFLWCGAQGNQSKQMDFTFIKLGERLPEQYQWIKNPRALVFMERLCNHYKMQDKQPLEKWFAHADPLELNLLNRMLVMDPNQRISAEDALGYFPSDYAYSAHTPMISHKTASQAEEDERSWARYQDFEQAFDTKGRNKSSEEIDDNRLASEPVEQLIQREAESRLRTRLPEASQASTNSSSPFPTPASPTTSQVSRGTLFHHSSSVTQDNKGVPTAAPLDNPSHALGGI